MDEQLNEIIARRGLANRKPNASESDRTSLVVFLSQRHKNGRLTKGTIEEAVSLFPFKKSQISSLWRRAKEGVLDPNTEVDISNRKKGNSGRKRKYRDEDIEKIREVPLSQRTTLMSLSFAISIPATSLWRLLKGGKIVRHSSALKPFLTEKNQEERFSFCRSFVGEDGVFDRMMNYIHINEKWFYMTKVNENYYLLPEEEAPQRTTKSKRFITKVMFLAAVARPRFDHVKNELFEGKIGIWPFVYQEPAKRNSKNCEKGTLETKAVTSVTKDVIRQMIIEKLFPAVKEKMPCSERHRIIIQQDNSKPHCAVDDPILAEAAAECNFGISFRCQPPNSPDLNVLDLGFLNSVQSLQRKKVPKTIDELVAAVADSFDELNSNTLNDVFLSLQMAMQATMGCGGGNNYKLGHMKKKALHRKNLLPESLLCDPTVLDRDAVLARVNHTPVRASNPTNAETAIVTATAVNATATPTVVTVRASALSTNATILPPPDGSKLYSLCETGEKVNCGYCGRPSTAAHFCLICSYIVHAICGTSGGEEGYGKPVTCFRCRPSNNL